jgi:hypothetical protein
MAFEDNKTEVMTQVDPVMDEPPADVVIAEKKAPVMGAHVQIRDKADKKRRNRRVAGVAMIWVVVFAILAAIAILGYVFRQSIVDRNPTMASVYKMLNIPVTVDGLDFEDPVTKNVLVDGKPVLIVNGAVINRSAETQDIPLIELSLLNNSGEVIASWHVEAEEAQINPKSRIEYISNFPNPPLDAVELVYKFKYDSAGG